ncbi:MAG: type II toxin-antitoxin system RelE/ParE family toxin [Syntrophomonadaceae bacterium]|nr:type II toxin-antitoxin system RelE/ParE family toxin [Syntrophomonadaceae bacterium]
MKRFSVEITKGVEKDLDDLAPYREQAVRSLLSLENNPQAGHALHGKLKEYRSLEFSLPSGVCRAIYKVLKGKRVCLIVVVGLHENIYDRAERRVKSLKLRF